jgi:hypothetical protein
MIKVDVDALGAAASDYTATGTAVTGLHGDLSGALDQVAAAAANQHISSGAASLHSGMTTALRAVADGSTRHAARITAAAARYRAADALPPGPDLPAGETAPAGTSTPAVASSGHAPDMPAPVSAGAPTGTIGTAATGPATPGPPPGTLGAATLLAGAATRGMRTQLAQNDNGQSPGNQNRQFVRRFYFPNGRVITATPGSRIRVPVGTVMTLWPGGGSQRLDNEQVFGTDVDGLTVEVTGPEY